MVLRWLTVAAVLITLGDPAAAQDATESAIDAERLRGAVREYLDGLAAGNHPNDRPPLRAGKITVVQDGETVRLAIAGLTASGPGGERVESGRIEIAVTPDDIGRYRVTVEPPKRIDVTDRAGREICRIALGGQKWTGVWSTEIAGFVEVEANMTDFGWRCARPQNVFASAVTVEAVMTEVAGNRWRGHVNLDLEGISIRDPVHPDRRLDFDHVRFIIAYENMDIDRRRDAIAANGEPRWAAALPVLAIPLDAVRADGNGALWRYASPATMRLEASGVKLASDILSARGGFELSLTGHQDRDKTLTFEIVYAQDAELVVAGTPTGPGEIWLDLVLAGLALDSLSPAAFSRMLDDPARLLAAAREITIRSVVASTPRGEIRGAGTLRPAPGSSLLIEGTFTLEADDLAGLILDFLAQFGVPAEQGYGDAVRATVTELGGGKLGNERFEIRVDPNGNVFVNHRDVAAIIALFQAHLTKR